MDERTYGFPDFISSHLKCLCAHVVNHMLWKSLVVFLSGGHKLFNSHMTLTKMGGVLFSVLYSYAARSCMENNTHIRHDARQ